MRQPEPAFPGGAKKAALLYLPAGAGTETSVLEHREAKKRNRIGQLFDYAVARLPDPDNFINCSTASNASSLRFTDFIIKVLVRVVKY
jgi:hypothetical protein